MSFLRNFSHRFTRKTHRYETKGELADMTVEDILRIDPDDVGFYIRNKRSVKGLNNDQLDALENLLDYKERAKKIGKGNIKREEEIQNYLFEHNNKELFLLAQRGYSSFIDNDINISLNTLINSILGSSNPIPVEFESKNDEQIFDNIVRIIKSVLKHTHPIHRYPTQSSTISELYLHLDKHREYYLTFSDEISQIVLKVQFVKYSEELTHSFDRSNFEKKVINVIKYRTANEFYTQDEYPYYFIPNKNNPLYGYFRIMEVISLTNISMDSFYCNFPALVENSDVPSIREDIYISPHLESLSKEETTISWYVNPGNLIWVLLRPTDNVIISNIPPPPLIPNEEEIATQFLSTFTDYPDFIRFINEYLSQLSPTEYANYYCSLSPSYFTTRAPLGYNFLTITDPTILSVERPFYFAMKYIFSIIPHFSPSTISESPTHFSEHTYFVYLNRLIYYYNIYIGISSNNLKGFENTAVIYIGTHGSYKEFDDLHTLEETPNIQNIFICTKATPGTVSYMCGNDASIKSVAKNGNMFDQMYDSMNQFKALSFDEISTKAYKYKIGTVSADCRVVNKQFGKSMQHYISPNTKGYINKVYQGSVSDNTDIIIDIKKFKESRIPSNTYVNDLLQSALLEGIRIQDQLVFSNILFDPKLLEIINESPSYFIDIDESTKKIKNFKIQLTDIIKYYNSLGIQNLFIYDVSCGVLETYSAIDKAMDDWTKQGLLHEVENFKEWYNKKRIQMDEKMKKLAELGFGLSKKKRNKRNKKTRKTRK